MVRMIVSEEKDIDPAQRHFHLPQADGSATSRIEQQLLVTGLDKCAWPKPIGVWRRRAGTQQRDLEIAVSATFTRRKHTKQESCQAS